MLVCMIQCLNLWDFNGQLSFVSAVMCLSFYWNHFPRTEYLILRNCSKPDEWRLCYSKRFTDTDEAPELDWVLERTWLERMSATLVSWNIPEGIWIDFLFWWTVLKLEAFGHMNWFVRCMNSGGYDQRNTLMSYFDAINNVKLFVCCRNW